MTQDKPEACARYLKILCAVDFSEHARLALDTAVDLASQSGGTLTLIHAYQIPIPVMDGVIEPNLIEEVAAESETMLRSWKQLAEARARVRVDTVNVAGAAWDRIVTQALAGRYDLVVIGTRGRTGIKHVLLGSVAERVVRHSPCPVLVVRPRTEG